MRQNCIDTIDTTTAPLPSWGQWVKAGVKMVRADMLQLVEIGRIWSMRAHHRRQLHDISDETLRDVGLNRAQIREQAQKPFWMA
ncbi:hypothetical protein MTBPR1_70078 [Candidatus Terasakiella magnetica]|uniref:YjiS-like domain-containing protein n=1 Tax=Candidatus Terasakiella magnetica TaxID=1867952 RepID=A0A1C3RKM8_9PROT|nr:DUF1127 domain-containing protein [Candidatus Terasakiella magnetica]SCA57806.1 hypothetical protein MTBPR1_70078 [Candidatus Terasakiella magnetica]